jgi:glycosyltransferase involved in cell wall biosynthesis
MPTLQVVVPVYNEQDALPRSIPELHDFLGQEHFPYEWRIVIADNASADDTPAVGRKLAESNPDTVEYMRIERKGRGYALKQAWSASDADVMSYMDVDLSTGLDAFPALIRAVAEGGYDVATGTRLHRRSKIDRSLQRTILSRGYNTLIKAGFWTKFSDAQCGFKAIRREAARKLLPRIVDNNWFFDTELLILAEKMGYRIKDVPVRWVEDPDSRVKIGSTVTEDLRGLLRMRLNRPWRQNP